MQVHAIAQSRGDGTKGDYICQGRHLALRRHHVATLLSGADQKGGGPQGEQIAQRVPDDVCIGRPHQQAITWQKGCARRTLPGKWIEP